jgi:hypothetical protein
LSNDAAIVGLTVYLPDGTTCEYLGEAVRECGITPHGVPYCTVETEPGKRKRFVGVVHVIELAEPSAVEVVPAGALPRRLS